MGLDLMTWGSRPETKSRVGCSTETLRHSAISTLFFGYHLHSKSLSHPYFFSTCCLTCILFLLFFFFEYPQREKWVSLFHKWIFCYINETKIFQLAITKIYFYYRHLGKYTHIHTNTCLQTAINVINLSSVYLSF